MALFWRLFLCCWSELKTIKTRHHWRVMVGVLETKKAPIVGARFYLCKLILNPISTNAFNIKNISAS
ncbi:TPA: hypothetical protein ACM7CU_002347, partial [Escherichia coli]